MNRNFQGYPRQMSWPHTSSHSIFLLDMKQADVNGDGLPDPVFLYGHKPDGKSGIFADHLTLVIQDGYTQNKTTVNLKNSAGYNARLFLGDFDKDGIEDILVTIDSGGSGGYINAYIYSFRSNVLRELFEVEPYNRTFKFKVDYEDFYKVNVANAERDIWFTLDIGHKGHDYLSSLYNENGKLKNPATGEVLALGALYPIVTDTKSMSFDLLALQRIIGTFNADTLGYVENLLTWDGKKFVSSRLTVAIPPAKLTALF